MPRKINIGDKFSLLGFEWVVNYLGHSLFRAVAPQDDYKRDIWLYKKDAHLLVWYGQTYTSTWSTCDHHAQIAVRLPKVKLFGLWLGDEHATVCTECGGINVPFYSSKKE